MNDGGDGEEGGATQGKPLTNVSPRARSEIARSGILGFLPSTRREDVERFFAWRIQKAIDSDGNPEEWFRIRLEHHATGEVGIWNVRCKLLDERGVGYYDVVEVQRVIPDCE